MAKRLVIVAGSGQFPSLATAGAKAAGLEVCVLALRGHADPNLIELADQFRWIPLARIGRWIKLARKFGAEELILAGGVRKTEAFRPWRIWRYLPDWRAMKIWFSRARSDRRNLAILAALADELKEAGITVINSIKYCPEAMAEEGLMTKIGPSEVVAGDIEFAWPIAQRVAEMDIGQALAVREKDIIAVEAIEGTDAMIERTGRLTRSGWTLIKVAQVHQDMRFDVPTVGPETIEKLHRNGAAALVVQAGKTLMIDKQALLKLAERYRIAVIGKSTGR
jgi:hypothetical protein